MKNTDQNPDYKPHENEYLRKKRVERNKTVFTRKVIYRLILMSLLLCGAFVLWAERTGFEGETLFVTTLGFFMMFSGVIALALVGAVVLTVMRRIRGGNKSSFLDAHEDTEDQSDSEGKS